MAFLHSSEILTSIFIGFLTQQLQTFFKRHLSLLLCLVPINQLTESPILHIFRFIHTCSCCLKKQFQRLLISSTLLTIFLWIQIFFNGASSLNLKIYIKKFIDSLSEVWITSLCVKLSKVPVRISTSFYIIHHYQVLVCITPMFMDEQLNVVFILSWTANSQTLTITTGV